MDEPGLVDYVIAPLTWLERSKGWKRGVLLLLYALTALFVGLFGWRELSLWRLPNIGEPFDVEALGVVVVPDADNAMILYREAARKLIAATPTSYPVASSKAWNVTNWGAADPEVRHWVTDNRPALATWLEGTERPDSLFCQPKELSNRTIIVEVFALRDLTNLAILEASRLDEADDMAGAWRMYRASLRASRHAGRHGGPMQRSIGFEILATCRPHIVSWTDDPRVTAEMLHKAIIDLEACKKMTSPVSEMVRAEYFASRAFFEKTEDWKGRRLDGPEGEATWYNHISFVPAARHFLMREPERSLRVLRLVTAGQLAQCDRPSAVRAKLHSRPYMIYEIDSQTPRVVAAMTPEELTAWADRSAFRLISGQLNFALRRIDSELGILDTLLIRMAERAYVLEHGKPPATYDDLLGPYLKALPDGIERGDRVSAASTPE